MFKDKGKTPINFNDYKIDYGRYISYPGLKYYVRFLYASNEKTGKEIVIQYMNHCNKELQTKVNKMFDSNCCNLPGVVKII